MTVMYTRSLLPLVPLALLISCAGARKAPTWDDASAFTEQGSLVKEQGVAGDTLYEFPDAGIPREAGTTAHDLIPGAEGTTGPVDQDGDGHCAKGTSDPGGKCKSFGDCDDTDKKVHPGAQETCNDVGTDNDCDGDKAEVDMDLDGINDLGAACKVGLPGICDLGTNGCKLGQLVCKGSYAVGQISEACNGKDDDCNGIKDDGQLCANGNQCAGAAGCRCNGGLQCSGAANCCATGCKNTSVDTINCGACNVTCGPGEYCSSGRCRCGAKAGSVGGGPACVGTTCVGGQCGTPCNPKTNLATGASATSSGGGVTSIGYGPNKMNDGYLQSACTTQKYCWFTAGSKLAGGKWIQYSWSKAVTIGRVWFDTQPASGGGCSTSSGRTLAGGRLQYRSGSSWKTLATVTGKTGDWSVSFGKVTTTQLRLYDAHATSTTGQKSNPIVYEWRVYCQ